MQIKDLERQILIQIANNSKDGEQDSQPRIIEIEASDIEKVVRRVIDTECEAYDFTHHEKNMLIETVYDALKLGDEKLS